jgi:hypothetical protein
VASATPSSSSAPRALRGEALRAALGYRAEPVPAATVIEEAMALEPEAARLVVAGPVAPAEEGDIDAEDTGPPAMRPHELALWLQRNR